MIIPYVPQEPVSDSIVHNVLHPKSVPATDAMLAKLRLPEGFKLERYFGGLDNPRIVKVGPNGRVYVTSRRNNNLIVLDDADGDGKPDTAREVQKDPDGLHGITFKGDDAYVIGVRKLWKSPVRPDGTLGERVMLFDDLPDAGQHNNRTLGVGPDDKLYISVGSTCNACAESNPENATMLQSDLDGKNRRIFASGLRNTIGFDWQPRTAALFGWDQNVDTRGDEGGREEINLLQDGKRFGWPYLYEDGQYDPSHLPKPEKGYTLERWKAESTSPVQTYTAHSAGMQFQFYRGAQFPAEYKGDAFVTLHGSWARKDPKGYEIVRVRFGPDGQPTRIEPFLTGFIMGKGKDATRFGRPCGLAELPDGSMIFSDDEGGNLYRISYQAPNGRAQRFAPTGMDIVAKLTKDLFPAKGVTITSPDFRDGGPLPEWASDYDEGRAPKLQIDGLPAGTKSVVLFMEDPDAAAPKPYIHWLGQFEAKPGTVTIEGPGSNSRGELKYFGPRPPKGDPAHRYHFTALALSEAVKFPAGFSRAHAIKAAQGKVLGQGTIVGLYKAK